MKLQKIVLVLIALALPASFARAEIAPAKKTEIETMLRLTGVERLMEQMKSQMIQSMSASSPDVPAAYWDKLAAKMKVRDVIEKLMPIYDKYYSLEDLRAVNAFYSSPTGQRVLATLPQVMQESMKVGQEWGQAMGQEATAEISAEKASKN